MQQIVIGILTLIDAYNEAQNMLTKLSQCQQASQIASVSKVTSKDKSTTGQKSPRVNLLKEISSKKTNLPIHRHNLSSHPLWNKMHAVFSHTTSARMVTTSFKLPYLFMGYKINPALLLLYKFSYLNPFYKRLVVIYVLANSQIKIIEVSSEKSYFNEPPSSSPHTSGEDVD